MSVWKNKLMVVWPLIAGCVTVAFFVAWFAHVSRNVSTRVRCDNPISYHFTGHSGRGVVEFDPRCIVTSNDVLNWLGETEDPTSHNKIKSWHVNVDNKGVPLSLWFDLEPSTMNLAPMP